MTRSPSVAGAHGVALELHDVEAELPLREEPPDELDRLLQVRAEMDHGVELARFEPVGELRRRHDVGELPFGEVAPLAVMPQHVAYDHVAAAGVIQRGHDIRSDKTGAPGHQQHACPCPDGSNGSFAPLRRGGQPASFCVVKVEAGFSNALPLGREPLPTPPHASHSKL
jgi:hypothetical protein